MRMTYSNCNCHHCTNKNQTMSEKKCSHERPYHMTKNDTKPYLTGDYGCDSYAHKTCHPKQEKDYVITCTCYKQYKSNQSCHRSSRKCNCRRRRRW